MALNGKHLLIAGLYAPDWDNVTSDFFKKFHEKWTMNDFFNFEVLKKESWDYIYQIHKGFCGVHESLAYIWFTEYDKSGKNWIDMYNSFKNTKVMTTSNYPRLERQEIFPLENAVKEMGVHFFSSTINMMFYMAIKKGFSEISLKGFQMLNSWEHQTQVGGVIEAIDRCKKLGIKVNAPMEEKWRQAIKEKGYAYNALKNNKDTFIPYWLRYAQKMDLKVKVEPCEVAHLLKLG